ncbi:MAG: Rad52/Rad22 family DNA repair protein [Oscillospiraceae bacterium]|nr:Rad52/Rad22 family DNA repair protein [Oscillospiraceae bacterium]
MTNEQFEQLKKPFKPDEVQWRITASGKGNDGVAKGLAVPYLDSRAIQNRLDDVVGRDNWQNSYTMLLMQKDNAFISTISIFHAERGEWVGKSNGAGSSDIEPIKGGLSDAFKRAASMWNIGRYLYEFEGEWVKLYGKSIDKSEFPRLDKKYIETVKKLFPAPAKTSNPTVPEKQTTPIQPIQPVNAPQPNQPQQPTIHLISTFPIYTVVNAKYNNRYTIIELNDGHNPAFTVYFNGEAKLAKNQCISNIEIQKKSSTTGDYYVLESYILANNSDCSQAA